MSNTDNASSGRPLNAESSPLPDAGRVLTIVVAEDEPAIRLVLANKLKNAGYVVHTAANGADALALVRSVRPDLIVTDFEMPRMDGLAMARALHQDEATRSIPLIVLSARGHRLGSAEASDTNVQHMLMKPFSMREVLSIVADYGPLNQPSAGGTPELGAAA